MQQIVGTSCFKTHISASEQDSLLRYIISFSFNNTASCMDSIYVENHLVLITLLVVWTQFMSKIDMI